MVGDLCHISAGVFRCSQLFRDVLGFSTGKTVTFLLPNDAIALAKTFMMLEQQQTHLHTLGVTEWGIGQTTLNEVFINIVEQDMANDRTEDGHAT